MADKQKVKITLLGVMKEYEIEVDDKKKFMKEIEALMKDGSMYWFKAVSYTHLTLPTI